MPSTSKKQHNFMEAVANNPSFAKKAGVPQSVGKDFAEADKGKKFGSGGSQTRADRQVVNQPKTDHGAEALFKQGGRMATKKMGMKKMAMGGDTTGMGANKQSKGITKEAMGKVKTAAPSRDGIAAKGKTKGMMPKMAGNSVGTGKAVLTHGTYKRGGMAKKMK
jgi:hypothetical protein